MKRMVFAVCVLMGATMLAQPTVPEIPFKSAHEFLKLPPSMNFGEVSGIAVNSKGLIAVYTRSNTANGPAYAAAASQILEFDQTGRFIREIGKGLYAWSFAHAVRFDKDDNLWAIDKGSDMIVRFNPAGHVTMVFGRKKEASDRGAEAWEHPNPPLPPIPASFRQPTDVTWDPEGNIFISDGYVNSRIAKFDKNGRWVGSYGEPGKGIGQLNTPHSIAADTKGNLYIADRGNRRIQVMDAKTGKFLREIKINVPVPEDAESWIRAKPDLRAILSPDEPPGAGSQAPGAPWAVCVSPGPIQYLYAADAFPGRVYKMTLDGQVVGWLGKTGRQAKEFGWIHELACPSENEVWTADMLNWRVQKLTLNPQLAGKTSATGGN